METGYYDNGDFRPRLTYGKNDNRSATNSFTFSQDPEHTTDEILSAADNLSSLIPEENIVNTIARNSLQKGDNFNVGGSAMVNRRLGNRDVILLSVAPIITRTVRVNSSRCLKRTITRKQRRNGWKF